MNCATPSARGPRPTKSFLLRDSDISCVSDKLNFSLYGQLANRSRKGVTQLLSPNIADHVPISDTTSSTS
jgi:hypothetical protein